MGPKSLWNVTVRLATAAMLFLSTPSAQGTALVLAVLFPSAAIHADEGTTVTPPATTTFDSYISQNQATTNFGTATAMHVLSRNANRNRRTTIQFNLTTSGIPTTAAVKVSYLRMFMNDAPNTSRTHAAHFVTGAPPWTGTTVTWNNRTTGTPWATPGGDFNLMPAATINTGVANNVTHTWTLLTDGTVPNIPQLWVSNPAANLGLIIKDTAESAGAGATANLGQYVTQNGANPAQYPMLELRYLRDVALGAPTAGISDVTWTWTFPTGSTAANYDGVLFARKPGTSASFVFSPADGTAYAAGTNLGNGEEVAFNTSAFGTVSVTDENGPDNVVLPGTAYTYKAFIHDNNAIAGAASVAAPHYAFGVSGNATTATGGGALKNWSYRTGAVTLSPPALDPGNVVLTGSNDSKLHSMNSSTGARNYQPQGAVGITGGAIQSRPALIPGIVSTVDCDLVTPLQQPCDVAYVSSGNGSVYAFNSATGALLWQSPMLGTGLVGAPAVQLKAYSPVSYPHAFDLVIVGTRNTADTVNNKIYGLNGDTGAIVWTFAPGNLDIISSTPLIDYNTNSVWVTSRGGFLGIQPTMWKLSTATVNPSGQLLNSVAIAALTPANRHIDASPEFDATTAYVFVVTVGGFLVAVDHANPVNVFNSNIGGAGVGFPILLPGAAADLDDIHFSTSTGVHKRTFNRTTQVFTAGWDTLVAALGGNPSTPVYMPAPVVTFLYVGVSDGRLKQLDAATGAITLTRDVNLGATIGDPSLDVVSSKFYVGDSSGRIYSFDFF